MQSLLRLPPCLRKQAYLEAFPPSRLGFLKGHAVTPSSRLASTNASRDVPKPHLRNRAAKKSPSTFPTPATRGNTAKSAVLKHAPPPLQTIAPNTTIGTRKWNLREVLQNGEPVLLYRSPDHTTLYIVAYFFGGLLFYGAYNGMYIQSHQKSQDGEVVLRKLPWYITSFTVAYGVMIAGFGLFFIFAPFRLIRSITAKPLVPGKTDLLILRYEIKSPVPFQKPAIIEVPPSESYLDRKVSGQEDVDFTSIPLQRKEAFTSEPPIYKTPATPGGFWHPWYVFRRDARRMFVRDSFARVRFEGRGSYKLDLQGCQMLDRGLPLDILMQPDVERGFGPVAWLQRMFV